MSRLIRVALAGNPNSGKTTIFNNLTGSRQHVGNYPGVTVEKKSARRRHRDAELELTDLPGTYNLTAWSLDEKVARDFLLHERPDVVVNILDASNLERNLYLTTQLMELDIPIVLVFNMSDIARAQGIEFDLGLLEARLGMPIVETVGSKNVGTDRILDGILAVARGEAQNRLPLRYGDAIEPELVRLSALAAADRDLEPVFGPFVTREAGHRWIAIKLLEQDNDVTQRVGDPALRTAAETAIARLTPLFGGSPGVMIADRR